MIQDIFPHQFHNAYEADAQPDADSIVLSFCGKQVLTGKGTLPTVAQLPDCPLRYLFRIDNCRYFLAQEDLPEQAGLTYRETREISGDTSIPKFQRYGVMTGKHLADWYRDNRFCGRCGKPMHHSLAARAMVCDACNNHVYPKIMPAVIVGVIRGDSLLLTKYRTGISYNALVAGFTEIGETLEETVAREVLEETGVQVRNIRYYRSQPWGIASDILAGFYCEADGSGEIRMDASELKYAAWVKREEIELQPDDASLTNEMMQMFRDGKIHAEDLRR